MKTKPIMLPTGDLSHLFINSSNSFLYYHTSQKFIFDINCKPQHIYLVSDDETKEGDWVLDKVLNLIYKTDKYTDFDYINQTDNCKRIIASTDKSLNLLYLDLSKDSWIIDYYNKNDKLPDEIELQTDKDNKLVLCNGNEWVADLRSLDLKATNTSLLDVCRA